MPRARLSRVRLGGVDGTLIGTMSGISLYSFCVLKYG